MNAIICHKFMTKALRFCKSLLITGMVLLLQCPAVAVAADYEASEHTVKAAFLINFTKFIEWPPNAFSSPTGPLFICIVGEDAFEDSLDLLEGRVVKNRIIAVRRMSLLTDDADKCHVLFFSSSLKSNIRTILQGLAKRHVLTVSDIRGFVGYGGTIEMYVRDDRVRFSINTAASRRHGLNISSKLLELAEHIKE